MKDDKAEYASSGVEQLIERLREEAVEAGQNKARDIVADAQRRAAWLIGEAEQEAKTIVKRARSEADALSGAGIDALNLAARDTLLKLRDTLLSSFSQDVRRVVGEQMVDKVFLRELILALAGQVRDQADLDRQRRLTLLIPAAAAGVEELRQHPEALRQSELSQLSAAIAGDMLRAGVSFQVSDDLQSGLSIKLRSEERRVGKECRRLCRSRWSPYH
jgi:V/A-type H+-transporting ATPase subunit E